MDFDSPPADPVAQLREWLRDAEQTDLPNPTAMSLSTVDADGRPSWRIVLLKGLDDRGIVFYTNRESRKGRAALAVHPAVSLGFHWDPLHRQVRVEGRATQVDDAESDAYFATRPRASQIGAWASRQSEPVASRAALDTAFAEAERRFEGGDVPRPPFWGGYRVSLESIMFWEARFARLHDRVVYVRADDGGWTAERLFP